MSALHVNDAGGVWEVQLARPQAANALTRAQLEQLEHVLADARAAGTRVLVLSGADTHFSAGMDFAELTGGDEDEWVDDVLGAFHRDVAQTDILTIGAVSGACVGAAFDLALALDLLVADEGAFFQLPAARFGLLYRVDIVDALVARMGPAAALRLLALGARLDAREAHAARIVAEVVERGSARSRALELARVAIETNVWKAVAATKGLIRALAAGDVDVHEWDAIRAALTGSPERQARVAEAREHHGRTRSSYDDRKAGEDVQSDS